MRPEAPITSCTASAFLVPTDAAEADGTLAWESTTLVVVEIEAGGVRGRGLTYAARGAASVVEDLLAPTLAGGDALDIPARHAAMRRAVWNIGQRGLSACAVSAADIALWDLKARLLGLPLASLLGRCRSAVPIYGSGGFTTYSERQVVAQFARWAEETGARMMKMKVGAEPGRLCRRPAARCNPLRRVLGLSRLRRPR